MKQLFFAARTTVSKNYDTKIERKLQFGQEFKYFLLKHGILFYVLHFWNFKPTATQQED
jgi:hypothetical protein